MSDMEKIKRTVAEIAKHPKNVIASEIEWVVTQLSHEGFRIRQKKTPHGVVYTINSSRFSVCTHHPGSKQIRPCYVYEFLRVMTEVGLYED